MRALESEECRECLCETAAVAVAVAATSEGRRRTCQSVPNQSPPEAGVGVSLQEANPPRAILSYSPLSSLSSCGKRKEFRWPLAMLGEGDVEVAGVSDAEDVLRGLSAMLPPPPPRRLGPK